MSGECAPVAVMEDGWSEWIHPQPGFLFQCCDCGLIHELEFSIVQPDTSNDLSSLSDGEDATRLIIFRARRPDDTENQPQETP